MFIAIFIYLTALVASVTAAASNTTSSGYRKVEEYAGSSFFDGFTWFNESDPTAGFVEYVDIDTSATNNLTAFVLREQMQDVSSYVGVDFQQQVTANVTAGLNSVRLLSKATFNVGLLVVVDVLHAPTGPGVWPAVWLLGNVSNVIWPDAGEIDIMEWVNTDNENHMTLHTASECTADNDSSALGTLANPDCNAGNGSTGCSITAPKSITSNGNQLATAGAPFNAQGGGVYVLEWTESGITEWLFPRDGLPQDLASGSPDPSQWTAKPLAKFGGSGCDFSSNFQQQQLIINIDLCGQWAGSPTSWAMMANITGSATCNAFVVSHPDSFKDAFFEFASIKVYSSNPDPPGKAAQHQNTIAKRSEGFARLAATDLTSRNRPLVVPRRDIAPYAITNSTTLRSAGVGPTPGLPSSVSSIAVAEKSDGGAVEASGYMFAAFIALLVAAFL